MAGGRDWTELNGVEDWLTSETLGSRSLPELVEGACLRLWAAGVPLHRVNVSVPTLHPLYAAVAILWERGKGVRSVPRLTNDRTTAAYLSSPFHYLASNGLTLLRRRIEHQTDGFDFPILADLKSEGMTDYLLIRVPLVTIAGDARESGGIFASWTTDASGGFSDEHVSAMHRLQRALALTCKVRITEDVARNIVNTYLGQDAGGRVLMGAIKHGDGETIRAAMWFSDLRSSTPLAASLARQDFITALNCYFDATAGAILGVGGEVLRFVGDAVLAIFPAGPDVRGATFACERAATAAREACNRLARLNEARTERGQQPLAFGVGLHLGDVMFGNIGVPDRLEFSVIGPTANEVARLEGLTKIVGRTVIGSRSFVDHLETAWEPLGSHTLRGVDEPVEVFAMPGA